MMMFNWGGPWGNGGSGAWGDSISGAAGWIRAMMETMWQFMFGWIY